MRTYITTYKDWSGEVEAETRDKALSIAARVYKEETGDQTLLSEIIYSVHSKLKDPHQGNPHIENTKPKKSYLVTASLGEGKEVKVQVKASDHDNAKTEAKHIIEEQTGTTLNYDFFCSLITNVRLVKTMDLEPPKIIEVSQGNRISLDRIFGTEKDLKNWLVNNKERIEEILGYELSNLTEEKGAGAFSTDLYSEEARVVMEAQFGIANHEHIGELLTNHSTLEAKEGILICEGYHKEHTQLLNHLKEAMKLRILTLKASKVEETPGYSLILEMPKNLEDLDPELFTKHIGTSRARSKETLSKAKLGLRKRKFWAQLFDRASSRTPLLKSPPTSNEPSISVTALESLPGFFYTLVAPNRKLPYCGLRIDAFYAKLSNTYFNLLYSNKENIEETFGGILEWTNLGEGRVKWIKKTLCPQLDSDWFEDEDTWEKAQEALINTLIKLDKSLKPYLESLKTQNPRVPQ